MTTVAYRYVQMTLFDAMQADHCWQLPDGSADRPFTQKHLKDGMRISRKRLAMWQQKSAEECRIDFMVAQVRKARVGRKSRCSPGLEEEIYRIVRVALEDDMGM